MLDEILQYNKEFVVNKGYENYISSKYPDKKVVIVTCMDTRLTKLLPAALGLRNGDVNLIKNAGGLISHPFGSVMRSLLIAVYELEVQEILVIGHTDCGAMYTEGGKMMKKMRARGIGQSTIDMVKYCGADLNSWLEGFQNLETSIQKSVELIRSHPLVPEEIKVCGLIIDSVTGELKKI